MKWTIAAALMLLPFAAGAATDDRGVELQLNGGVVTFPGAAAVDPGAAYGVGLGLEPWSGLGVELGYQGAAYGQHGDVGAVENGGYAALKLSPLAGVVEPYALGGVGVSHLNVTNREEADADLADDTLTKVPVGAGLDFHMDDFTLGARGTYDFVFDNDHALQTDTARGADQLMGTLQLGAQF